jgi:hypothetical protein
MKDNSYAVQALRHIAEVWDCDSYRTFWSEEADRFDWWPGDFRVHVRAHQPSEQSDESEFCISIQTGFLKDVEFEDERFQYFVTDMSRFASTYALVYPPADLWRTIESKPDARLSFSSSAYISPHNIDWLPDLLARMSIIQPINAQIQAQNVTSMLGSGLPDITRPDILKDAGLADILDVVRQFYAPLGADPSKWVGTGEFEEFVQRWGESQTCFGTSDACEMTLQTPFGDYSAWIRFITSDRHPQLGNGLRATLQLPYSADKLEIVRHVAELNFHECMSWTNFPQLGCWHPNKSYEGGESVAFTLFVPNLLYQPGLATQIAFWFLQRARWARERIVPQMADLPMIEILRRRSFGERGRKPSSPVPEASSPEEPPPYVEEETNSPEKNLSDQSTPSHHTNQPQTTWNLREALKNDFGIDVLIKCGHGLRDDPFVIEPCSAADATRTQLNLLRGLGRGRRELWRLLQAETVRDIGPAMQRLQIEAVSFTPQEVSTEVRGYYFDVSEVNGVPDAGTPLIEWTDPRTSFSAVSQIGWLHFDRSIDNSGDERLDTSLQYSAIGAKATIYVYGSVGHPATEWRAKELHSVCSEVRSMHAHAEMPWPVRLAEPFALQYFLINENLSVAGIAVVGRHFLKFRLTYNDDPKMRELMNETIGEVARLANISKLGSGYFSHAQH